MQPASGVTSPVVSQAVVEEENGGSDDDQPEEDNIRNLHFSTVPVITTGI